MRITVLDADTLGADLDLSPLYEVGEPEIFGTTAPEQISERISESDVVIINKVKLNGSNLENADKLRLICIAATGYDNIDTVYCQKRGIAVCNVIGYSSQSVAQVTVSMALSLCTKLNEYTEYVNGGAYSAGGVANRLEPVYHEICGKTWGIVGYGNIGRQVGRVAEALGCRVIVNKRTPTEGVECVGLETLMRESDIISIHTPLNDSTHGLVNREMIALCKKDAIIINVARGAVCDERALTDAIKEKRLGGIGVDVYTTEPFLTNHPYSEISGLPNVCLTPHMAWGAHEARVRCLNEIILNIKDFYAGGNRSRVV